jgi:hypothetical protein
MKPASLLSRRVVNIDVPEPTNFRTAFVYNFFTPSESVNDQGEVVESILNIPSDSYDQSVLGKLSKKIPRYVRLEFTPVANKNDDSGKFRDIHIADYLTSIQDEQQLAGNDFTRINFEETSLNSKLFYLARKVLGKKIDLQNQAITNQIAAEQNDISSYLNSISPMDQSRLLNRTTSGTYSQTVLSALNNIRAVGATFIDETNKERLVQNELEELKSVGVTARLNNKVVGQLAATSANDVLGSYETEINDLMPLLISKQNVSRGSSTNSPDFINASEYDIEIPYILSNSADSNGFKPSLFVKGYIIDKYEILSNGNYSHREKIVIESASTALTVDLKVKYGATYMYLIRSVGLVNFEAIGDAGVQSIISLIASKPIKTVVTCTESVPPPPPSDFNVVWDYENKVPFITWNFPVNTQRDIKKFQVFKRLTINEPFQLVKVYDFNDSVVKFSDNLTPLPSLLTVTEQPINYFRDFEFNKEKTAIYSVCSIDAHGLSSNYSIQFAVRFDPFANQIIKDTISSEGAPIAYPNMYLNQDTFVDTIKTSNAAQVKVVFNPEYMKVLNNQGDLHLLATNRTHGKYRVQFINTDLQEQVSFDINLNDRRQISNE